MNLLRWSLFSGLLCLPLMDAGVKPFGTRVPIFNIYFGVLVLVALLAYRQRAHRAVRTNIPILLAVILLLISWFTASIMAIHVDVAIWGAIRNTELLVFALILASTIGQVEHIRLYVAGLLGAVAWVSFIGWIQSLFGNYALQIRSGMQVNALQYLGEVGQYGERTVTAFGDPIMSGHFLAVGMCMALGWALTTQSRRERAWLLLLAGFALVPLLTSASRGPIVAALLTSGTLLFYSGMLRKKAAFLWIAGAVLVILYRQEILSLVSTAKFLNISLIRIGNGLESSRWDYWQHVVLMSTSYPIGVGIGNFAITAPVYIPSYLLYVGASGQLQADMHAESMYLTQLIEIGWIGFLAFVTVVTFSLYYSWRLLLNSKRVASANERTIRASVFGAWMCIAISMLTTYGYNNFGIAMLFWFLVGISITSPCGIRVRIIA